MSTNANIAIRNKNGSFDVIYLHWDGYPSDAGAILFKHYDTEEKVRELISLGNISTLGECIGEQHYAGLCYEADDERVTWTRAYGRDRGEKDNESFNVLQIEDIAKEDYSYAFAADYGWIYCEDKNKFLSLKTKIDDK